MGKKKKKVRTWTSLSLPSELVALVDDLLEHDEYVQKLYGNRTKFIIDAVRHLIEKYTKVEE